MSSESDDPKEEAFDLTFLAKKWTELVDSEKDEEVQYFSNSLFHSPQYFEETILSLEEFPFPVMIFKSKAGDFYFLGLGEAERRRATPDSVDKVYFGGEAFNPQMNAEKASEWQDFGQKLFMAPRAGILLRRNEHIWTQKIFVQKTKESSTFSRFINHITSILAKKDLSFGKNLSPHESMENPDRMTWTRTVDQTLKEFKKKNSSLEKIVLSRKLVLNRPKDPESSPNDGKTLLDMYRNSNDSYFYLFRPAPSSYFVSVSPEKLFTLKDEKSLSVDAIAGTRKRGSTEEEDRELSRELCEAEKDRREHRHVKSHVQEKLSAFGTPILKNDEVLLKLNHVQHLYTEFELELNKTVTTNELIHILHPTPAVGGAPTDEAFEKINHLEKFSRGWYAGPLGILTPDFCEMIVGIRSGLKVVGPTQSAWHIFAGAGIVPGSCASLEWEETQQKMQNFLRYWEEGHPSHQPQTSFEQIRTRV